MMDKIILNREKTRELIFRMFDINEDQYICFTDTYQAMSESPNDLYNSDISTIQENQSWKKQHEQIKKGWGPFTKGIAGKYRKQ